MTNDQIYDYPVATWLSQLGDNPASFGYRGEGTWGTKFSPILDGRITAIRARHPYAETHNISIWDVASTALLATKTIAVPGGLGWTSALLDAPISVVAGAKYIISVAIPSKGATTDTGNYYLYPTPPATYPHTQGNVIIISAVVGSFVGFPGNTEQSGRIHAGADVKFFGMAEIPTIAPAPERLPHVITREDTGGNQSFQRKLQDNFDTIERQLLALDPDNQGNKDPNR